MPALSRNNQVIEKSLYCLDTIAVLFELFLTDYRNTIRLEICSIMESEMIVNIIAGATLAVSLLLYFVYTLVNIEEL